jgi:hypothetical protein
MARTTKRRRDDRVYMTRVDAAVGDRLIAEARRQSRSICGQIRHLLTQWAENQTSGGT